MLVRDVMSTDLITVPPDMPAPQLARLLVSRMITGAPVVDSDGYLLGVVSRSDLLRHASTPHPRRNLGDFYLELWAQNEDVVALSDSVKAEDMMNREALTVLEHAPIGEVAEMLLHHRVHRLIVTRHRKVVGVVTTSDLVRCMIPDRVTV